ncbi:DUF5998 family protein [Luteococcus peritonei]
MNPSFVLPTALRQEIDACGYFPDFVAESVAMALGDEQVDAHLVHHEATFANDEIHRHLTVLVATPTRLLITHTDDGPATDGLGQPAPTDRAVTSSEAMPLSSVGSVALSRVVASPESHPSAPVVESWLTIGWGTMRRLDLEPAGCQDPTCEADHGYTGTLVGDDITIRMSEAADGAHSVRRLVDFATVLQHATGRRR